ncbi:MAG TPA: UDP-2,3-diacylglucosamine diphosphatase LpxI [Pirellulaceae bacterium]|jgi:hypothetical protein|nr:UDP-2,3-diacylglucosamine diphosphatase LpxI [Pirellulaceae bacterium]
MTDYGPTDMDVSTFGLMAGWGRYPIVIARTLRQRGIRVVCVGVKDHADPQLQTYCDDYVELGMGKLGAASRFFRRHGVKNATMAGKIHKIVLFQSDFFVKHFPDWKAIRTFFSHFISKSKDRKDDTLLLALTEFFQREGVHFAPATNLLPELLVKTGILSKRQPSTSELKDIRFGWDLAKEMGRLDVGQTVAVKGRAVLAVEAVEGTDLCIRRAGDLCTSGGFTVVKVAKPHQDMRFDVPTIGVGTLKSIVAAGARVLAVESDKTVVVDEPEVVAYADRHRITIVALQDESASAQDAA